MQNVWLNNFLFHKWGRLLPKTRARRIHLTFWKTNVCWEDEDTNSSRSFMNQMWWHMINNWADKQFPNFRFSVSDIQSNSYRASVFDGSWISGALAFPTIIGLSVTVLKWKMMWRCYWYNLTLCSLFLFQSQYIEISSRYIWRKMWAKFVTFYESILSKSFWLKTCQGKLNIN